jgi:hypothetical protein
VYVTNIGIFFMNDGALVADNRAEASGPGGFAHGGGVYLSSSTFLITGGTVYGSDAAEKFKNVVSGAEGAALYRHPTGGSAQYGHGSTWTAIPLDDAFPYRNATIKVENGDLY